LSRPLHGPYCIRPSWPAERLAMSTPRPTSFKATWYLVIGLLLGAVSAVVLAAAVPGLHRPTPPPGRAVGVANAPVLDPVESVELVEGMPFTLSVPEPVQEALGIHETVVAERPTRTRPIVFPGSTALDPTRLMRVRTRFNAEVVEMATVTVP